MLRSSITVALLTVGALGATVELLGTDSLMSLGGGSGACVVGVSVDELTNAKSFHVPCVLNAPTATIGMLNVEGAIRHFDKVLGAAEKRLDAADARMACQAGFECVSSGSHLKPRACSGETEFQPHKSFPSTGFLPCQTCSQAVTCVNGEVCRHGYVNDGTNRGCKCRDPAAGATHGEKRWTADAKWPPTRACHHRGSPPAAQAVVVMVLLVATRAWLAGYGGAQKTTARETSCRPDRRRCNALLPQVRIARGAS